MKKLYISTLFLLITLGVFGQYSISFNDTLRPFGSGAYSLDNIQKDDSFYYATGIFIGDLTNYSQQPFVLKFNKSGSLKEKRILLDSYNYYGEYFYNSALLHNNTLFQLVIKTDSLNRDLGTVLAIDKQSLDTLWTKTYAHPDTIPSSQNGAIVFSVLTAIKPTPDGGYILTGNYNKDCITGNLRSFLMKIDSVGNVEWRRTYDNIYGLYDIELSSSNGFVLINKYWGPHVIETDSFGNIVWQKKINNHTINATVSDLTFSENNSFVGIVKYLSGGTVSNPVYGLNVFKVNLTTHQILWDKTYQLYKSLQCISMHQAMGVETLPNGDIIVSGTAKNYGYDAVILKLNSNGDSLWCKSYDFDPDPWDCQLNDLIITEDGGFMGVGFFSDQSGPGWTAWMFKTDASGTIGWEEITKTENRYFAKIYPNPAHDFTTLKYDCSYSNLSFAIMDASGRVIKTRELETMENASFNEVLISLEDMSPGTYYLVVKSNHKNLHAEKLIITR